MTEFQGLQHSELPKCQKILTPSRSSWKMKSRRLWMTSQGLISTDPPRWNGVNHQVNPPSKLFLMMSCKRFFLFSHFTSPELKIQMCFSLGISFQSSQPVLFNPFVSFQKFLIFSAVWCSRLDVWLPTVTNLSCKQR